MPTVLLSGACFVATRWCERKSFFIMIKSTAQKLLGNHVQYITFYFVALRASIKTNQSYVFNWAFKSVVFSFEFPCWMKRVLQPQEGASILVTSFNERPFNWMRLSSRGRSRLRAGHSPILSRLCMLAAKWGSRAWRSGREFQFFLFLSPFLIFFFLDHVLDLKFHFCNVVL